MNTLTKAVEIIRGNEGNYNSVNSDDNGALSIGCLQWHGNRAKTLLHNIVKKDKLASFFLSDSMLKEINDPEISWEHRKVTDIEWHVLRNYLDRNISVKEQNSLIARDVSKYIRLITSKGITDFNSVVLLADIYNQSPTACNRIMKQVLILNDNPTLENVMKVALTDKVIRNYSDRRYKVYKLLTGKVFSLTDNIIIYTVAKGDTLSKIAKTYDTDISSIAHDNGIENINNISIGQKLKIYPSTLLDVNSLYPAAMYHKGEKIIYQDTDSIKTVKKKS
jgi:LysM repeat protein